MKKFIMGLLAAATMTAPVVAGEDKITKGYNSMDAMGCMLLRECTDGVKEVYSLLDISSEYSNTDEFTFVANEFNNMLTSLNSVGVKVFLANSKYFPDTHRGVYHTVSNNFYLNKKYMGRPGTLMQVMRHEGWHAAQDCMAGTIDNTFTAVILQDGTVPQYIQDVVARTYPPKPRPWENEAFFAATQPGLTVEALSACAAEKPMWEVYTPTPLTREWLYNQGWIK